MLLFAGLYTYSMLVPPQVAAVLTLQVNPAFNIVLDDEHRVIALEGINDDGQEILSLSDLQGKTLGEALEEITTLMHEQGFLMPDSRVEMILHADLDTEETSALLDFARQSMTDNLSRFDLEAPVECFVLSKEFYEFTKEYEVTPMDYVDFLRARLNEEEIRQVITALKETSGDAVTLPYDEFELEIKYGGREISLEFKQQEGGSYAEVKINQPGRNIKLEGSAALDYLLPILNKLELDPFISREELVDMVLAALGWTGSYDEIKFEGKFADGSSIEIEWNGEWSDDDADESSESLESPESLESSESSEE